MKNKNVLRLTASRRIFATLLAALLLVSSNSRAQIISNGIDVGATVTKMVLEPVSGNATLFVPANGVIRSSGASGNNPALAFYAAGNYFITNNGTITNNTVSAQQAVDIVGPVNFTFVNGTTGVIAINPAIGYEVFRAAQPGGNRSGVLTNYGSILGDGYGAAVTFSYGPFLLHNEGTIRSGVAFWQNNGSLTINQVAGQITSVFANSLYTASLMNTINVSGGSMNKDLVFDGNNSVSAVNLSGGAINGNLTFNKSSSTNTVTVTGGSLNGNVSFGGGVGTLTFNRTDSYIYNNVISGNGQLVKTATGWLTLGGANTYTRGTILSNNGIIFSGNNAFGSGAITIAAANTILSNVGSATLDNDIVFGNFSGMFDLRLPSNSLTVFNGTISGGGPNVLWRFSGGEGGRNTGVLTLNGTNTFAGKLEVFRGPLILGNSQAAGNSLIILDSNVNPNGSLQFSSSFAISNNIQTKTASEPIGVAAGRSNGLTGVVSSTGGINKVGAGTLYYLANNTYTGTTTISAGSLIIGNGGTVGSLSSGNVVNNAALTFNRSDSFSVANTISGAGSLSKLGAGTVTLLGANTYRGTTTISNGTLQIGANGTAGAIGTGDVINNGVLIFNRSDAIIAANNISGSGALIKRGNGTTTLAGKNTYSGATTIEASTLVLNGTHTGGADYTVKSEATLTGTGSTASTAVVKNGGKITPGAAAGDVLAVGGLDLNTGGTLNIFLNATSSSLLDVNGNVALGGGVNFITNATPAASLYTFVAYTGTRSNVFGSTNQLPSGYALFYDDNDKTIFLRQSTVDVNVGVVFDQGNEVITGGLLPFEVAVVNAGSSAVTNFTATSGPNVTGSIGPVTVATNDSTNFTGLQWNGTATNTNTGTFSVTYGTTTTNVNLSVVVYDHAAGSLLSNTVTMQSAIAGYTNVLPFITGSVSVTNSNGFRVNAATVSSSTNSNISVQDVQGIEAGSSESLVVNYSGQEVGRITNNVSVAFRDDSTLNGAATNSTNTLQVVTTIYDGASGSLVGGTNLSFARVHQGYTNALTTTNSLIISNAVATVGDFRVALGVGNNLNDTFVELAGATNIAQGTSSNLTATLLLGREAGQFSITNTLTFYDDSDLLGASTNRGTTNIVISGYVYSGKSTWTNTGSGNWTNFDNWDVPGGTPGLDGELSANDTATFGTGGSGTVTLDTNASLLAMTFSNATSYALQGTGTLTFARSGDTKPSLTTAAGSHVISNAVEVDGDLQLDTTSELLLAGSVSGVGSLRLIGAGTTTLAGSNSFSGGTVIDAGRLVTTNANALGSGNVTINSGGALDAKGSSSLKVGGDLIVEGGTYLWSLYNNTNSNPGVNFTAPLLLTGDLRVAEDSPFALFFTNSVSSGDPFWTAVNTRRTWRVMESVGNSNNLADGFSFKPVWATGSQTNGFDLADFFFTLDEANGYLELNYLKTVLNLVASNALTGGTTVPASANYASVSYETDGLLLVNSGAELIITDPVVMSNNSTTTINGSFVAPGGVTVQGGSTIGGSGTIDGEIVNNGTFAPAVTNSSLTINNDLTFNSGSSFLWTLFDNTTNGPGTNFSAPVSLNANMTVNSGAQFQVLFTNNVNPTNSFWVAETTNSWIVMTGGELGELQSGANFTIAWAPGSQTNGFKLRNFYLTTADNNLVLNWMPGLIVYPGADVFDPGVNEFPWIQYQPNGELEIQSNETVVIAAPVVMSNNSTTIVNGQFTSTAGSFAVMNGSTVGGNGTINGNLVNNGLVSPGNSPGTLSIGGDFTQTSSGSFLLEAGSLSIFDRLSVTGAANLAGELAATGFGGHTLSVGDSYQFLTADGGISGTFDTITMPAGLRGRFVVSGANNSLGTLFIAPATYTSMAITPNQFNAAAALDNFIGAGGDRGTVSAALDTLTAAQYPAAFEQMMPSQYASLPSMAFNVANALNSSMFQQLWVIRVNGKGFNASGVNMAPMQAEMGGTDDMGVFAINPSKDTKWSSFVDGNGVFANASSTGSTQNYRSQSGGVSTGAAYSWNDAFATGVYVGYQGLQAEYDSGRTIDNAVRFGVFGTYDIEDFYFNALVGGAYHGYTVNRYINFGGLNRTATGRPGAGEFDLALGTGYDFDIGNFSWGPFTTLQYTYIGVQGFTETGAGALNLDVDPYNSSSLLYTLGAQAAYNWKVSDKVIITPTAFAGWQHEFLQNGYGINSTFATGGPAAPFNYNTSSPARDNFYGGVGVTVGVGESWQATFIYSASAANQDNSSQNLYLGLGYKF